VLHLGCVFIIASYSKPLPGRWRHLNHASYEGNDVMNGKQITLFTFLCLTLVLSSFAAEKQCATIDKVTLQLKWTPQAQFAGYYVGNGLGYYKDECLDVTIRPGELSIEPEEVVAKGDAQFGITWQAGMLSFVDKGVSLKAIAQVFQTSGMRLLSWKESNIRSADDLKGKRVAVWFGGNQWELLATLAKHGFDPEKDITLVSQPMDMNLLLEHKVDVASAMTYNELAQVLETVNPVTGKLYQPTDLNVIDFNREGKAMLEDRIFVMADWLKDPKNQDIAVRFLRASLKGWIYCRDHPAEAVAVVLKTAPNLGHSHQAWQMNEVNKLIWPSPQGIGVMDARRWDETAKILHRYHVTKTVADRSVYTNEFVEKALRSLNDVDTKGLTWKPQVVSLAEGGR
jgi:NitT/TauT family transport system substrate-binding protein